MKMKRAHKKIKELREREKPISKRKKSKRKSKKKTYYETALKHIQGSVRSELPKTTGVVSERTQRYTARNIAKQSKGKLKPLLPEVDFGPDDSVITLSDNEIDTQTDASKLKNNTDNSTNNTQLLRNNSKRQKVSSVSLNSSCFIISEDEGLNNSDLPDTDRENQAPQTSKHSTVNNNGLEDIEVIWSSMKSSTKENECSENNNNKQLSKKQRENVSKKQQNEKDQNVDSTLSKDYSSNCKRPMPSELGVRSSERPAGKRQRIAAEVMVPERPKAAVAPRPEINEFQPYQVPTAYCTTHMGIDNTVCWDQVFYNRCTAAFNPVSVNAFLPTNIPDNRPLREIIIDGNNVGMLHTNGKAFSERGVELVVDHFQKLGHIVKVFIPQYRRSLQHNLLERYYKEGIVVFTPSRQIGGKRITPYDDRYILQYATTCGGIIVSSDQYRDLYKEKPEWRETIEKRLLMPTFVGDYIMFPEDPLGRGGPKLDDFLRH